MSSIRTIALDAMGGDFGPEVVVAAAVNFQKKYPDVRLILVGLADPIKQQMAKQGVTESEYLFVQACTEVVAMDELPSQALRKKKDSSMRVAVDLMKDGRAHACVSAGNTGALMAISRFVLKTLPTIDRPALCNAIPSITGHTHVLDLGANVDCNSEHLFQFAIMGSVLASAVDNIENPRVGLLNIGQEQIKGNERVKEAALMLSKSDLNYIGFVEGDDVYKGGVDVVVCDGFVGNVALKTSEGVAKMISHYMREEFSRNWLTRLVGLASLPVLRGFKQKIDPRRYNGASLLGLRGIVIKSHGSADPLAFGNAIKVAMLEVDKAVPEKITRELEARLGRGE